MTVGGFIKQTREKRHMTQSELAELVNISQSMLCQIERGTKPPSLSLCISIADALGCGATDIVECARSAI